MTKPAVCFGGPSPEHDISILTGLQAAHALAARGREAFALYWSPQRTWHLIAPETEPEAFRDGLPANAAAAVLDCGPDGGFFRPGRLGKRVRLDIDVVVNCCHGAPGEDGSLQALFDLAGLRYTGPTQAGAALGMDKLAFAGTVAAAGLPTLRTWPLTPDLHAAAAEELRDGPLIVKPRFGGSSMGIEIVDSLRTAQQLARTQPLLLHGAVVQRFIDGAIDLNIAVRTWPQLRLSPIEKPLRSSTGAIYTYAEKYLTGAQGLATAARELPADLPEAVTRAVRRMASSVSQIALARSVARIDFLWDGTDNGIWVNEINTIPGSLGWYFWAASDSDTSDHDNGHDTRNHDHHHDTSDHDNGYDTRNHHHDHDTPGQDTEDQIARSHASRHRRRSAQPSRSARSAVFGTLLDDLIAEAAAAPLRKFLTDGADGTALSNVNAIAAKLA